MGKFLVFDVDNSLATLGGPKGVSDLAGIAPIRITHGAEQVRGLLRDLFTEKIVEDKHELFDKMVKTVTYEPTPLCQKVGLEGIVIDTLSHLFRQDQRILERANKSGALEMQDWGKLERMYNTLISTVCGLPLWVVVNCHISYDKDQATGMFYFAPQIQGSTKNTIFEYFDCTFFTKTSKDGRKIYTWQTYADTSKWGKDRLGVLEPFIPQDFKAVLDAYHKGGVPNPKIIVIGESGTGKTRALRTIIPAKQ